eukprot:scaffold46961_cov81-Phaeocystis_antarctica.AAC.3
MHRTAPKRQRVGLDTDELGSDAPSLYSPSSARASLHHDDLTCGAPSMQAAHARRCAAHELPRAPQLAPRRWQGCRLE